MKFSELLDLKSDSAGNILKTEIEKYFPHIPLDIIEQVLIPHGRNGDFQFQYGHLDLDKIIWKRIEVSGKDLINCSFYKEFSRWIDSVIERADKFNKVGWRCIDSRIEVVDYWKANNTWMREPVFINGILVNENSAFRLVEGHTRIGTLIGLVKNNIIEEDRLHKIWFGDFQF